MLNSRTSLFKFLLSKNAADSAYEIEINGKIIGVTGLDIYKDSGVKRIEYTLNENNFNILLVHDIDGIEITEQKKIDITLSGHKHAGEIDIGYVDGSIMLSDYDIYKKIVGRKETEIGDGSILSYISPGLSTHNPLGRIGTQTEGVTKIICRRK